MIDIENEVFTLVATALRAAYSKIFVTGEYVKAPSSFPCVSLVQASNTTHRATQTSTEMENHADIMFEVNIYSNKETGKKTECKAIAAIVDDKMKSLGFDRAMLQPISNLNDTSIYRMTGRYRAVVSKDNTIYRR